MLRHLGAERPAVVVGAGPHGPERRVPPGRGFTAARAERSCGRLVPLDRGERIHVRLRRAHHVLQRAVRTSHVQVLLGTNVHWQDREAWIYSKNVYTRYPFQGALYGLPPQVIKECIVGAIEARFGALNPKPDGKGEWEKQERPGKTCRHGSLKDCCADGIMEADSRSSLRATVRTAPPGILKNSSTSVWGAGIAKHFAIPYNRKLWAVPLNEMETSWLGGRVPLPDLRGDDRRSAPAGSEAHGAERAVRISLARRFSGADGRFSSSTSKASCA